MPIVILKMLKKLFTRQAKERDGKKQSFSYSEMTACYNAIDADNYWQGKVTLIQKITSLKLNYQQQIYLIGCWLIGDVIYIRAMVGRLSTHI